MENEYGLEIGDDAWWAAAEKRVRREHRRERRRARLRTAARWSPVLLVVVLVAGGGVWAVRDGRLPELPRIDAPADVAAPAALSEGELAAPFLGTPAESLAAGAAGIVPPPAKPVGRYTAAQVAGYFQRTRALLTLSRLDARLVERRDPSALLAAFSPREKQRIAGLLGHPGDGGHHLATRLAPSVTQLAPPRVTGTMTPRIGRYGELTVATDYVFVYALKPDGPVYDRTETHLVLRAQATFAFLADGRYSRADQGASLADGAWYLSNIDCDEAQRGFLRLPRQDAFGSPEDEEERRRRYEARGPLPTGDDCDFGSPSAAPSVTAKPTFAT